MEDLRALPWVDVSLFNFVCTVSNVRHNAYKILCGVSIDMQPFTHTSNLIWKICEDYPQMTPNKRLLPLCAPLIEPEVDNWDACGVIWRVIWTSCGNWQELLYYNCILNSLPTNEIKHWDIQQACTQAKLKEGTCFCISPTSTQFCVSPQTIFVWSQAVGPKFWKGLEATIFGM